MKPRIRSSVCALSMVAILAIGIACTKTVADSDVTSEVQNKLNADSGLQGKQLVVQTSAGVVTLSGAVDNDAQRTAASRYASSVAGVKQVVNDLQVVPAMAQQSERDSAPAERPRRADKPRPSLPRENSSRRSSDMAAATPPPSVTSTPMQNSAPAPVAQATPAPPSPARKVTIPSGTSLSIRLVDELDSETAQPGQSFKATLDAPLSSDGDVVIPVGYEVQGHVIDVKSAGKFAGKSVLALQLDRIAVGGKSYSLQTDEYRREGSSRGKNTAEKVGAGAAIGAIIGGIAGGGKGAGIGAAAGGGLGGGVQAATKGQQIKLPSETVLNFSLQSSLTVTAVSEGPNAGRRKLETPAEPPAQAAPPSTTSTPENLGPQ